MKIFSAKGNKDIFFASLSVKIKSKERIGMKKWCKLLAGTVLLALAQGFWGVGGAYS